MLPAHWSAWFTRLFCRWRAFYRQMMSQRVCAMRCCWSNSNRLVNLQLAGTGGDYTILYTDKTHGQGHVKTPTISYRLVMSPWMCRPLSMGWMHGQRLILIYCELWNILWYLLLQIFCGVRSRLSPLWLVEWGGAIFIADEITSGYLLVSCWYWSI